MNLVIVESPTKAKKLSTYLGKDFTVKASVGHVRDLPKSSLGVDTEKNFEPIYEVSEDKKKVVTELQKLAKSATKIYLATDPDREGEAISWHIQALLENGKTGKQANGSDERFFRATFHEITKTAVMHAIDHPSALNMHLVDAQQARRVVDRLVGYKLSPVLWKKIRRGLSAGRVQSVALRLIVEREREIEAFKPEEFWEIDVLLNSKNQIPNSKKESFKVENSKGTFEFKEYPNDMFVARVIEVNGKKYEPKKEEDVSDVVKNLETAQYQIQDVERKERRRASLPPFTTSTLQQTAATRLGFTSKQTMTIAQQLYEEGLITYHRTDSVNLSQDSITMAREFIKSQFGDKYLPSSARLFASKSKNAQEAHEAIRSTEVAQTPESIRSISSRFTQQHIRLFDLIQRRFIASQMESAVYDQTTITVDSRFQMADSSIKNATLRSSGSVLKFDGWMKLFPGGDDALLPNVEKGQLTGFVELNAAQKFTQPPARFNDASLVKTLEQKGIGRPSTYASIISVIVDRGYVERKEKRFFATAVGMTVSDFLLENFPEIMDYDFTAEMEEDLDRISRGEKEWRNIVKTFYTPLEKKIDLVTDKAERVQVPVEETGESCPDCGSTEHGKIVIRTGRFGKFKSCSRFPDCKFTENIVDIVEGVKCPLCGEGEVVSKNTRWGKPFFGCKRYPTCDWASWKQPEPGEKVTKAEWKVMQAERKERMEKRQAAREAKYGKPSTSSGQAGKQAKGKTVKKKAVAKKKTTAKKKTVAKKK